MIHLADNILADDYLATNFLADDYLAKDSFRRVLFGRKVNFSEHSLGRRLLF